MAEPAFARGRTPVLAVWLLAALLAWTLAGPARADFDAGVRAYDAGDYEAAFQAWLPLARDGDPFAQRNLGHLYRLGRGVPQDFAVAANWYRRASDQGLVRAQTNLANMYLRGQGVDQDTERAAAWFHRAAVAGHTIAQFNMGLLFDKGLGVPRDRAKAMGWFLAAAEGGHEKALELLEGYRSDGVKAATPEELRNEPKLADAINAPPGPVAALPRGDSGDDANPAASPSGRRPPPTAAAPAPPRAAAPPGRAAPGRTTPPADDEDDSDDPFASRAPAAAPVPRANPTPAPAPAQRPQAAARPGAAPATSAGEVDPLAQEAGDSTEGVVAGTAPSAPLVNEGRDTLGADDLGAETESPAPPPPAARTTAGAPAAVASASPPVAPAPTGTGPGAALAPAEQQRAVELGLEAYRSRDYAGAMRLWRPLAEFGNRDAQFYVGGLYMDGSGVPADVVQAHAWWRLSADKGHAKAKEFVDLIESIMTPEERAKARDLAATLRQSAAR